MMNELTVFNYGENNVRTITKDGEPWFLAKDVCDALGLQVNNLNRRLPAAEKSYVSRTHLGFRQGKPMVIISESGVYTAILRSDKKEAEPFRQWVTGEVLPTIRKTGTYTQQAAPQFYVPQTMGEALRLAADLSDQNAVLVQKVEAAAAKVAFAEHVEAAQNSITFNRFAKILHAEGLNIGEFRLTDWLRRAGYLMFSNLPYQKYLSAGYFEVIEKTYLRNGLYRSYTQTLITGKGQIAIADHILQVYPGVQQVRRKSVRKEVAQELAVQ